jgi:hypothetical protein
MAHEAWQASHTHNWVRPCIHLNMSWMAQRSVQRCQDIGGSSLKTFPCTSQGGLNDRFSAYTCMTGPTRERRLTWTVASPEDGRLAGGSQSQSLLGPARIPTLSRYPTDFQGTKSLASLYAQCWRLDSGADKLLVCKHAEINSSRRLLELAGLPCFRLSHEVMHQP